MYSTAFVSSRLLHFRFCIPEYSGAISFHWMSVKSVGYGLRPAFTPFMLLLYYVCFMKTSYKTAEGLSAENKTVAGSCRLILHPAECEKPDETRLSIHEETLALVSRLAFHYGGSEGSRTPVRRLSNLSFSERSLCFRIPSRARP